MINFFLQSSLYWNKYDSWNNFHLNLNKVKNIYQKVLQPPKNCMFEIIVKITEVWFKPRTYINKKPLFSFTPFLKENFRSVPFLYSTDSVIVWRRIYKQKNKLMFNLLWVLNLFKTITWCFGFFFEIKLFTF